MSLLFWYLTTVISTAQKNQFIRLLFSGTQEKTKFSGPVFNGLSCGVVHFVLTVSFWSQYVSIKYVEASHCHSGKSLFFPKLLWPLLFFFG